jgi:hypothetical protein
MLLLLKYFQMVALKLISREIKKVKSHPITGHQGPREVVEV